MKQILLFDTAIGTSNLGDEIILDSVKKGLYSIIENALVFRLGTHIENYNAFQMINNWKIDVLCDKADFKFVCGTNLLDNSLRGRFSQWQLNKFNSKIYKDSVLVGVGRVNDFIEIDNYTKNIYNKVLSKKYKHSVRDDKTKDVLENIGIKAINTGCPTLWGLNAEHCSSIPNNKADNAIISVSGYNHQSDFVNDCLLVDIVRRNYNKVYAWIQTVMDEPYLNSLPGNENIERIYSFDKFSVLLENGDVDYIGTRLHGGIFALQHKVRTIVISIDERAQGFHDSNNLPIICRTDISNELENKIYGKWETNIHLDYNAIEEFLSQFQ